jgi:UDP-N-acetylglucosamine pyrophosphorylase
VGEENKMADHFFKSNKKSVKFFSQHRFTKAFMLLVATYSNLAATAATRP